MEAGAQLQVRSNRVGFTETITVVGELDVFTAPLLVSEVSEALDAGVGKIIIDAAGLTFIDGMGVDTLVLAWQAMEGRATMPVVVTNLRPGVQRVLEICGVNHLLVE